MRISESGITLLVRFEGLRLEPYRCPAGLLTIGVGHVINSAELVSGLIHGHSWRDGLTEEAARHIFRQDLNNFEIAIDELVKVPLQQHEFDALVMLVFNIGIGAFTKSTVLRRINSGEHGLVPAAFMMWVVSKGKILQGLRNRRAAEVLVWKGEKLVGEK